MAQKNFVVSFASNDDNTKSVLSGYNRQIMEIMININNCNNYENAENRKIAIIYEFIQSNIRDIENIIYIYGFEPALTKYQSRFNGLNANISVLIKDLAIMIIDEIICIYEVQKEEVEKIPIYNYNVLNINLKRESSISNDIDDNDNSLQFNMDARVDYNTIIGTMISENSNY
tara:strand:- start:1343 stop:1861 length:519 start_codon:yes stop_codon:yes gene_type:complete